MIEIVNNLPQEDNVIDYKITIKGEQFVDPYPDITAYDDDGNVIPPSYYKYVITKSDLFSDYDNFNEDYYPDIKEITCTKDMCLAYAKTISDEVYNNTKSLLDNSLGISLDSTSESRLIFNGSGSLFEIYYDMEDGAVSAANTMNLMKYKQIAFSTELLNLPDDFEIAVHVKVIF